MPEPYKILVVDDEPDLEPLVKQRMRRQVRSGRYTFVFAHNGVEALERMGQEGDVDMVLSDINMPRMDGLTLLEQIPSVDPNVRSVIVSAYGDMKNIRTAMNRGAFDFVTKPIDFEDLQITIERTLRHMEEWRDALISRDKLVALQNELEVASKIQQSILPTEFPKSADYEIYAGMSPAREVAGDFYDVVRLANGKVGLAIADVSDKGVPSALFMMSSRTLLKGTAVGVGSPSEVLAEVNDMLCEGNETVTFVTVLYAEYNPANGKFTYSNGGHTMPVVIHKDGTSSLLPPTKGVALGVMPGLEYQQKTVTLTPGDMVILYTDGVSEAMNVNNEEFGVERLCKIFADTPPSSAAEANQRVFEAVSEFAGEAPQSDDVACLTLHHRG